MPQLDNQLKVGHVDDCGNNHSRQTGPWNIGHVRCEHHQGQYDQGTWIMEGRNVHD